MIIDTLDQQWEQITDVDDADWWGTQGLLTDLMYEWTVPEGWMQGRSLFGGLTAAAALTLAEKLSVRQLRTMQAQLIGPVVPGKIRGVAKTLRSGKNTTFVEVRLKQQDDLVATFTFIFVVPRKNARKIAGPSAPKWTSPEESFLLPYIEGVTPEFTQNLEFRFAYGGIAFQGEEEAKTGGYIQFRDATTYSTAHQLALLDAWFPPIYTVFDRPVMGSTVTWTAHLFAPSTSGLHQFKYDTLVSDGGFSTSVGHVWDSKGTYVAYTEQTVVSFE